MVRKPHPIGPEEYFSDETKVRARTLFEAYLWGWGLPETNDVRELASWAEVVQADTGVQVSERDMAFIIEAIRPIVRAVREQKVISTLDM